MAQKDDVSSAHFNWLVESRSRNQRSTLKLYELIDDPDLAPKLSRNTIYQDLAQNLAAVAFSLWRAVFLSDLSGSLGDQLVDVRKFLQTLIAHNAILYQTDFNTREWTFDYYLDNALFRLDYIRKRLESEGSGFHLRHKTAKDNWTAAQGRLDAYLDKFTEVLSDD